MAINPMLVQDIKAIKYRVARGFSVIFFFMHVLGTITKYRLYSEGQTDLTTIGVYLAFNLAEAILVWIVYKRDIRWTKLL